MSFEKLQKGKNKPELAAGEKAAKEKSIAGGKKAAGEKNIAAEKETKGIKEEEAAAGKIGKINKIDKKQYERQIFFVIGLISVIFITFIIFFFIFKNAGNFTYKGIKFQKTTLGDSRIPMYQGQILITRLDNVIKFSMYLRNDPRTLSYISTNLSYPILLRHGYISFEPRISSCFGSSYASFRLAEFLGALGMNVKGATTDASLSEQKGIELRTCDDAKKNNLTIIVLQPAPGNATAVQQEGLCYTINIANCEIIPASEKFILEIAAFLKDRK